MEHGFEANKLDDIVSTLPSIHLEKNSVACIHFPNRHTACVYYDGKHYSYISILDPQKKQRIIKENLTLKVYGFIQIDSNNLKSSNKNDLSFLIILKLNYEKAVKNMNDNVIFHVFLRNCSMHSFEFVMIVWVQISKREIKYCYLLNFNNPS